MRYRLAPALALVLSVVGSPALAIDCEALMKSHGFASRAQFQCGFDRYSEDMLRQAKECGGYMSEARLQEKLTEGMKLFDRNEKERGHKQMCGDVLRTIPRIVGR